MPTIETTEYGHFLDQGDTSEELRTRSRDFLQSLREKISTEVFSSLLVLGRDCLSLAETPWKYTYGNDSVSDKLSGKTKPFVVKASSIDKMSAKRAIERVRTAKRIIDSISLGIMEETDSVVLSIDLLDANILNIGRLSDGLPHYLAIAACKDILMAAGLTVSHVHFKPVKLSQTVWSIQPCADYL